MSRLVFIHSPVNDTWAIAPLGYREYCSLNMGIQVQSDASKTQIAMTTHCPPMAFISLPEAQAFPTAQVLSVLPIHPPSLRTPLEPRGAPAPFADTCSLLPLGADMAVCSVPSAPTPCPESLALFSTALQSSFLWRCLPPHLGHWVSSCLLHFGTV